MARVARRTTGRRRPHVGIVASIALLGLTAAAPSGLGERDEQPVTITLLATNDFHGQLQPPTDVGQRGRGGAAYLAAHLDAVRARAPEALYVDAGDMTGSGTGISRRFGDEPTVEAMGLMGLDVAGAGNHEFDQGLAHLRRNRLGGCRDGDCAYRHEDPYAGASFETLAANVIDDATGDAAFPAWTIRTVSGVDVGVVGLVAAGAVRDGGGVTALPQRDVVNPAVEEVVAAGADVVVVLWHDGSRQNRLLSPIDPNGCHNMSGSSWWFRDRFHDEVDVVVDGHTHQPYVCDVPDGPILTQATDRGTMLTEITLTWDPATAQVVDRTAVNRYVNHGVVPDPEVQSLIDRYRALGGGHAPSWADLDGDTLGDGYEVLVARSDPYDTDTDDDGLDDDREVYIHRSDPRRRDTDRGGAPDGAEVEAGLNPTLMFDDVLLEMGLTGPLHDVLR